MDWNKLSFKDWVDISKGFTFIVDSFDYRGESVECIEIKDVVFAKQHFEYNKLHRKDLKNINLLAVRNQDLSDFYNRGEYWADIERWEREEVK